MLKGLHKLLISLLDQWSVSRLRSLPDAQIRFCREGKGGTCDIFCPTLPAFWESQQRGERQQPGERCPHSTSTNERTNIR